MAIALVLWVVVSVVVCLGVAGVDGNVQFSTEGATEDTFSDFMMDLRAELTKEASQISYDIPVLSRKQRFVLVDLSNDQHSITVPINAVNVYVLGYCACQDSSPRAYFYENTPDADIEALFPTVQNKWKLPFRGSYPQLERYARDSRENIYLGKDELKAAIRNLWNQWSDYEELAKSSLVLIQMVAEAARYRFIEARVGASIVSSRGFRPDSAMLELETRWGRLSFAIQHSVQGVFRYAVQVNGVKVDSVYLYYVKGLALLINSGFSFPCLTYAVEDYSTCGYGDDPSRALLESSSSLCYGVPDTDTDTGMLMPVGGHNYYHRALLLNGLQGLCADAQSRDEVQLSSCGTQTSKWTLVSVNANEGEVKIQELFSGKCLKRQGSAGSFVNMESPRECDKRDIAAQLKWTLSLDGTITNADAACGPLVLNADEGHPGSFLTVQTQNLATGQSWRFGVNRDPATTSIRGRQGLCLQPNEANTGVEMKQCFKLEETETQEQEWEKQQWDLYSDGSIRVHRYSSNLCLTASGRSAGSGVEIRLCAVDANQRWLFKNNGLLLNPVSGLALEKKCPFNIILNTLDPDNRDQQWLPYF